MTADDVRTRPLGVALGVGVVLAVGALIVAVVGHAPAALSVALIGTALVVFAPLVALARRVGSSPDDPAEIERRVADGLELSDGQREARFASHDRGGDD